MSETRRCIVKVPLLLLLSCCWLLHTGANTQMWHGVGSLNAIEGTEALGVERKVCSKIQCGMMASVIPNAHIFCFTTPDVCTVYDYKMDATSNASSSGGQKTCYSRVFYACDVEGELLVNDDCSIFQCQHNVAQPYEGTLAPPVPFKKLVAKNCIHIEITPLNFASARLNCQALGGDLYVAGDFQGMSNYITTNFSSLDKVIVGANPQVWLDGRPVAPSEWTPGQPDTPSHQFVNIWVRMGKLDDQIDTDSQSLCQKGVSYS